MFKTKKDSGIIKIPMLAPHLELFTFSEQEFGLTDAVIKNNPQALDEVNFTFVVNSKGQGRNLSGTRMRDILRAIDGKRSRYDICDLLKDKYLESDINVALAHLAYQFIIVSAEHKLEQGHAVIWSEAGISPYCYQEIAEQTVVHCVNFGADKSQVKAVQSVLKDMHISYSDNINDATLIFALLNDYLQPELLDFNRDRLKDKKRWMPIKLADAEMMYGPIFEPEKDSACLHCITNNMRNNREFRGFLELNKPGSLSSGINGSMNTLALSHIPSILFTVMKSIIVDANRNQFSADFGINQLKLLNNYAFTQDVMRNESNTHFVNKRPQCLSCGDAILNDKSRSFKAVNYLMDANPESVFTSGGMKSTTPEQTFKKYEHLISAHTGIISSIERSSPPDDEWMYVYWSGSNLAIMNRNFRALTNSIRSKSAGKGRSMIQAKVSAMCEALERYSGVFNGDEIRKIAKFSDFPKGDALHPNDLMLFSENQYKNRDAIAESGHRFYQLPAEDFDKNADVEWTPVWSITQEKTIWMMSYQLYFSYDPSAVNPKDAYLNRNFANPDSNGAASGNTPAEAFVQGFMELIERDAYAVWWYNRVLYPEVDLASFNDPYLDKAITRYQDTYNRKLWVLDLTNDFGIPVFAAISYRFDKKKQDICISAGAHFDPHIAALRAVCELNQYISAVLKSTDEEDSYTYFDKECNDWWQNATIQSDPYLLPDPKAKKITKADYPITTHDLNEELQTCIDKVHEKGLEILVLDQTRADIKLPVIKVMVPGMRHFWARFGEGRLYDVPVTMGKLDKPLTEAELNPIPVFI